MPNMVSQCQTKKGMGRPDTNLHRQTDRETDGQTDRQSDSYIPPWTSFKGGIIRYNAHIPQHTCRALQATELRKQRVSRQKYH